jgi:2-keto-4-pentenoate hydratase/2-oxohepta-3-ene-1,7-dioic acid hydratase in catechol pathway
MKIASYLDGSPRIGLVDGDDVWNLRELYSWYIFETERSPHCVSLAERLVPDDMALFIRLHHGRLDEFETALALAKAAGRKDGPAGRRKLSDTRLLAPVLQPTKVVCCGSSYGEYLAELGMERERWPQDVKMSFLKPPTALIGHGETIPFPPDAHETDYENELAIVIGRPCSDIPESEAGKYIFGYSVFNDACVRDIPKWTGGLDSPRGKAGDGCAPMGPWIVPAHYLGRNPNDLGFTTWVDGEVRQKSRTSGLLWPVERIVAFVSHYIRLSPGDVISTGSTKGNAHTTGKFLKPGQVVRCEIEGIGVLENRVGQKTWKSVLKPLPALS